MATKINQCVDHLILALLSPCLFYWWERGFCSRTRVLSYSRTGEARKGWDENGEKGETGGDHWIELTTRETRLWRYSLDGFLKSLNPPVLWWADKEPRSQKTRLVREIYETSTRFLLVIRLANSKKRFCAKVTKSLVCSSHKSPPFSPRPPGPWGSAVTRVSYE